MHFETSWHADGLRWIASLFLQAADRIERSDVRPYERQYSDLALPTEPIEDVRTRILTRYF